MEELAGRRRRVGVKTLLQATVPSTLAFRPAGDRSSRTPPPDESQDDGGRGDSQVRIIEKILHREATHIDGFDVLLEGAPRAVDRAPAVAASRRATP